MSETRGPALKIYTPSRICESCGHQHLPPWMGAICVGCSCPRRPITVPVYCRRCTKISIVNAAQAFTSGWPKHCGETMTLDQPASVETSDVIQKAVRNPRESAR